jgi:geranylgeranyl pyrophosphate synthase
VSRASDFAGYLAEVRPAIEEALERLLPAAEAPPARLHAAMRYSVFAGGKRLRPTLVVLAGELCGAARARLVEGAAAVELVHTYSLVHDDLPALDDDDLRRGRPTLHRAYDEATAILAGDALLTLGLETLATRPEDAPGDERARAVALLARAAGSRGMIGGQMDDLVAEAGWPADAESVLARIHRGKTAALFAASLRLGALHAGAEVELAGRLAELGERLGLLFQGRDDLLDVEGTTGELGKTAGKDARAAKLTAPALLGAAEARRRLAELAAEARVLAEALPLDARLLASLVDFLAARDH